MRSDGTSALPPKGQAIAKSPSTRKTIHHSSKSSWQRDLDQDDATGTSTSLRTASSSPVNNTTHTERDLVKAYLRIRPLTSTQSQPPSSYLKVLDDQHVSFIPPEDTNAYRKRQGASDQYQFTKVFTDITNQQQFFEETTLPLLQTFIHGNNALIFAYGVTKSGKTHSMLGSTLDAGIVPRTIHILFDNLQNRLSQARLKPAMHSTIQSYDLNHESKVDDTHENRSLLLDVLETPDYDIPNDNKNVLDVDSRFEYGIWISFAEIYNEKVYDLLECPNNKKQGKRPALPLKYEYRSGYKYVAGLKHVRVKSAKEAYTVIHKGQQNRAVFSTLMNQYSSRSHSVFTISLVRCPIDQENYVIEDPAHATMSKMSIVDLAGSERYRNTFSQGQRLKEAGNINKSLMVLGQCMETLRMNQIKIDSGKRPAMVPFRQSKLTELFKNTFEGDGQVAIVVNVNPFDTGFDENSHVMKFAAIAKEVTTVQQQKKSAQHDISDTVHKRQRQDVDSTGDSRPCITDIICNRHHDAKFVNKLLVGLESLRNKWLESNARHDGEYSEIQQKLSSQSKLMLETMENSSKSMTSLYQQKQAMETQNNTGLEEMENPNEESLDRQTHPLDMEYIRLLSESMESLTSALQLMKDSNNREMERLDNDIDQLKALRNNFENNSSAMISDNENFVPTQSTLSHQQSDYDNMVEDNAKGSNGNDLNYALFLELRKKLRRSVFKRDELLEDAENILHKIEQFENVTFDLVKNTKMGKLLKLITQEEFKNDPYEIQQRALVLFKRFARLPRPMPPQGDEQHSPANSTEYHSSLDDFDRGHQEADPENTLLNDFGDDYDDDSENENGNAKAHTNESGIEPLGEMTRYNAMVTGDDVVDPLSSSAYDERPTRKRRRKLRIRG